MKKRGQVSIFIIIGVVLILAISLFFLIRRNSSGFGFVGSPDTRPIEHYIDLCIKSSASDALYLAGVQGGYTKTPNIYFESGYARTAYWYNKGEDISPSVGKIEQELSLYVDDTLPECMESLKVFSDMGYEFEFGELKTEAEITENNVDFNINYPIKIIKGDSISEISDFHQSFDVRLGHIIIIAKEIVEKEIEDPDWIDMTYLTEQDIDFNIYPYNENIIIYSLADSSSKIDNNLDFVFIFANHFNESEALDENE
ncbi:MAG: hypothetical protein PHV16_02705 [Candidatus Nanoarchaeia archaeon]|nr:hypothetical protein [Candidatus Nanoarchaeia archaeon]